MRVSVIIPAVNERERIARAVESAWDAKADEVLVVDGGSTDGCWGLLQDLKCHALRSAPGRAVQQNVGAREATGDYLLFQHADNRLGENAIDQLREACRSRDVVCGAYRQRIEHHAWRYRLLEWGNNRRVRWRRMAYGDQGIFVRQDVFWQEGGFPEVPLMEDVLLMKRLRRISRPLLLDGPLFVDARRWQRHGVVRQTLRNWFILCAHRCGASPQRLAKLYRRHDK